MGTEATAHPGGSYPEGTELAGYVIHSLVGRGGAAYVYRAQDRSLGRTVALKVLAPDLANDAEFRRRFLRESELAASLDHPNVLPIYDAGETDGILYLAMRYVEGRNLREVLAEEGPLEATRLLDIVEQVADALDEAHRHGLVHRDVKPANILITPARSGHEHVYVSDFGVTARAAPPAGALPYLAPEQLLDRPVTPRTDVYALGCLVYECLTGAAHTTRDGLAWPTTRNDGAFPPTDRRRPDVRPALRAVVATALAHDADDRYPTCGAFVAAIDRELHEEGQPAPRLPAAPVPAAPARQLPIRRFPFRRRTVFTAIAGLLAVVVLLVVYQLTMTVQFPGTALVPLSFSHPASWKQAGDGPELIFSPHAAELLPLFTGLGGDPDTNRTHEILREKPTDAVGVTVWVTPGDGGPLSVERQQQVLRARLPGIAFPVPGRQTTLGDTDAVRLDATLSDPATGTAGFALRCYAVQLADSRTVHLILFAAADYLPYQQTEFEHLVDSVTVHR